MVLEEQNGTNFVTRWNDAFGGSVYAEPSTKTFPTWLPDPANRRPFISQECYNLVVNEKLGLFI